MHLSAEAIGLSSRDSFLLFDKLALSLNSRDHDSPMVEDGIGHRRNREHTAWRPGGSDLGSNAQSPSPTFGHALTIGQEGVRIFNAIK